MSTATMTTTSRRRSPRADNSSAVTPSLIDTFQTMSIRKGETFHSPTAAVGSDFWDPLEARASSSPIRSATCPKALEDLLIGAGERRTSDLLSKLDDSVKSKLAISNILTEPEALPGQTGHSHASDSGLGSSIVDSDEPEVKTEGTVRRTSSDQSLSGISDRTEPRGLSKYASDQIQKHIVRPLLAEDLLKDFHPLVREVPVRIENKQIGTLRDLERTLIFRAPDFARSPLKYLQFCERTIRVLHTTVTTIHESDQRVPADRPYTQGYFFDLVDQIRRYASILAATREKQAKGETLGDRDYSENEKISIVGGMSHNGKPAELVRHKDGKVISLATGETISAEDLAAASGKRPMSDDFDADLDSDVLRSMARRKKNAKPEVHPCSLCDKDFKRPCDLTKHYKTHERPWKCPDSKCKYHDQGWPTEKERDRHVNDKHSNAPTLYHCIFAPCPYTSKRESNCKQHMEKAHGWDYIRSKNNGKGNGPVARLPQSSVPQSPAGSMLSHIAQSPSLGSVSGSVSDSSRHASVAPPHVGSGSWDALSYANISPNMGFDKHFRWDFNDMAMFPMTPLSDASHISSDAISSHSGGPNLDGSVFDGSVSPEDLAFDQSTFHFGPEDFAFPNATHPSAAGSVGGNSSMVPHASPGEQLDPTFDSNFYDSMNIDSDFSGAASIGAAQEDFTLFSPNGPSATSQSTPAQQHEPQHGSDVFPMLRANAVSAAAWTRFGAQSAPIPQFITSNSALDDLFPELTE